MKAIELMIFEGLTRNAAAERVGLKHNSLYKAFQAPHVRRFYREECDSFRENERSKNTHVAIEIRDDRTVPAKARIDSMKFLENKSDAPSMSINVGVGVAVTPGYIVDVGEHSARAREILRESGSSKSVLDNLPASPVIDATAQDAD
jgi:hypothetical protein